MRRVLTAILFALPFAGLFTGLIFRDKVTNYMSSILLDKGVFRPEDSLAVFLDSAYNYTVNSQPYRLTWLEFGSTHCRECQLMEDVMRDVREKFSDKVKVVFYDVSIKETKPVARHFGVLMIPVQVILDKNGQECYRHTGYLSFQEISKQLNKYGLEKTQSQ